MKKTLLTAALVAGFAGAAHAETSVTLYGVVDGGVGYNNTKTTFNGSARDAVGTLGSISATSKVRDTGVSSGVQSGNRWGLKGVEDLGNGTSVIFQLESGFNLGDGTQAQSKKDEDKTTRLFGRKAILGLTGESWGTLTLGRQYNVGDDFLAPIDPFGTGFGQAAATNVLGTSWSGRYDSSIKYMTPNFSGFQAAIMWAGDDNSKVTESVSVYDAAGVKIGSSSYREKNNDNLFSLGLGYNNGPIQAGLVWDHAKLKESGIGYTDSYSADAWNLGFAYDFDVVKLHLGLGQQRDGFITDTDGGFISEGGFFESFGGFGLLDTWAGDNYKQTHWLVGLSAPVGEAGKVLFSYQGAHGKNMGAEGYFAGEKFEGTGKLRAHVFSLGYTHNLSKRTNLYALASYGTEKTTVSGDAVTAPGVSASGTYKVKSTQINVGLRHRF